MTVKEYCKITLKEYYILIIPVISTGILIGSLMMANVRLNNEIKDVHSMLNDSMSSELKVKVENDDLKAINIKLKTANTELRDKLIEAVKGATIISRGKAVKKVEGRITMYHAGECGKQPDNALYGITAGGQKAREKFTIAQGTGRNPETDLLFGTKVYIPELNLHGEIWDRFGGDGSIDKSNWFDVYSEDKQTVEAFGVRHMTVYIMKEK